jgi:PAS domain S-box-containing protein
LISVSAIALALAGAVALMINGVKQYLPQIAGLDYRVLQIGIVMLVFVFLLYTFERERHLRRITGELVAEKVESARAGSKLDLFSDIQTERDTVSALLGASADGILVVDAARRADRANPALRELVGLPERPFEGALCEEVLGCRHGDKLACGEMCPFERVIASGQSLRDHSFATTTRDGRNIWLSGAYSPVRDLDGNIAFGIASLRDVTRAKEVEQLQHDFVSIVSHELRGPLTAIKGFVTTLISKSDRLAPETRFEFLETINHQADRLNQLVEDLLNVSRIDSRRLQMKMIELDLEALTRKLVGEFYAKWGSREITIDADPALPLVMADRSKIEEVLINLIDNAVKYSPAGGSVKVTMVPTRVGVQVAVEDSGIGIAPEDAAKLFQKFNRIASEATRDIGGTGLGLYIVRSLVEAHGGRIWLTSAPGEGSTFTFTLPKDQSGQAAQS